MHPTGSGRLEERSRGWRAPSRRRRPLQPSSPRPPPPELFSQGRRRASPTAATSTDERSLRVPVRHVPASLARHSHVADDGIEIVEAWMDIPLPRVEPVTHRRERTDPGRMAFAPPSVHPTFPLRYSRAASPTQRRSLHRRCGSFRLNTLKTREPRTITASRHPDRAARRIAPRRQRRESRPEQVMLGARASVITSVIAELTLSAQAS